MIEKTHFEPVRLEDYRPPVFSIESVTLEIELDLELTRVVTRLSVSSESGRVIRTRWTGTGTPNGQTRWPTN